MATCNHRTKSTKDHHGCLHTAGPSGLCSQHEEERRRAEQLHPAGKATAIDLRLIDFLALDDRPRTALVEPEGDALVLRLGGEHDVLDEGLLEDALSSAAGANRRLVIDLAETGFVGSRAIHELASYAQTGKLELRNASPTIGKVMTVLAGRQLAGTVAC